jgi:serine/threonine-protein kinase
MKLVEGVTLREAISRSPVAGRTDAALWELLQAFLRVCDAMAFAHSLGVVHCDLKPDNVMLGQYGQVYVMDWGIARLLPESKVRATRPDEWDGLGFALGTAQYMAPEQAWGRTNLIDARTDVYAIGGLLYAILTGHAPHQGSSQSDTLELARKGAVRDPAAVCPGVAIAPSLCAIAMKALAKKPDDRHPSAEALKLEVERALREGLWFGSRVFPAGMVILREGDPGDAAYIVTKGRCEVTRRVSGESLRIREMGPGEAFGELALVSDRPRSATVTAIDEVTAMVITREALARELQAGSWMGVLVRTLVQRFQDVEEKAISRTR